MYRLMLFDWCIVSIRNGAIFNPLLGTVAIFGVKPSHLMPDYLKYGYTFDRILRHPSSRADICFIVISKRNRRCIPDTVQNINARQTAT